MKIAPFTTKARNLEMDLSSNGKFSWALCLLGLSASSLLSKVLRSPATLFGLLCHFQSCLFSSWWWTVSLWKIVTTVSECILKAMLMINRLTSVRSFLQLQCGLKLAVKSSSLSVSLGVWWFHTLLTFLRTHLWLRTQLLLLALTVVSRSSLASRSFPLSAISLVSAHPYKTRSHRLVSRSWLSPLLLTLCPHLTSGACSSS